MKAGWAMPSVETEGTSRLSVVIACLDAADMLGLQLSALAGQECPVPWEVLVCDNGSTDATLEVARSWADRLPLRIVDASDVRGAGPARNAGARLARGDWLAFCDADDEVGHGWLAAVCAALARERFVAGRFDTERLNSSRVRRSRGTEQESGLQYSSTVVDLPHAGAGNLGIHRSVFLQVGGFDASVRYLQDTDLCWRVQLAGHRLAFAPDMLVHVRLRATFRGMYRQGYNYGRWQALLERRYGDVAAVDLPAPAVDVTASPGTRTLAGRMVRLIRWAVANRVTPGGLVWQLGWHHGSRAPARTPGVRPALRDPSPTVPEAGRWAGYGRSRA